MLRRAQKLRARIGCAPGESPRVGQEPKYMRMRTYWRLREQANALDEVSFLLAVGRFLPHVVPSAFARMRAAETRPRRRRRARAAKRLARGVSEPLSYGAISSRAGAVVMRPDQRPPSSEKTPTSSNTPRTK